MNTSSIIESHPSTSSFVSLRSLRTLLRTTTTFLRTICRGERSRTTAQRIVVTLVILFGFISSPANAQSNGPMVVSVAGFRSTDGQIMAFLFSNADDFPTKRDKAFRSRKTAVTGTTTIFVFDDVPAGAYGVAVYHDENSNGKMDRHWYGTPMEGYGASNDATGSFGPPKFADAKFEFHSSRDTVRIQLHY